MAEARRVAMAALRQLPLTPLQREAVVEQLLYAEVRGKKTHGLVRIPWLLETIAARRHRSPKLMRRGSFVPQYEGGASIGYVAAEELTRRLMKRALRDGAAVVACRNLFPTGVLGYHVEQIAQQEFIGFAMATTPALVSLGRNRRVIGTNPIAIGYKMSTGRLFLVDVACAPATFGQVLRARWEKGITLARFRDSEGRKPSGQPDLFDAEGKFSGSIQSGWSDPLAARLAALALAIDVTARCLTGDGSDAGSLVLAAVRPEYVDRSSRRAMERRLTELAAMVGELPGEHSATRIEDRLTVSRPLWTELLRAAR